MRVPRMRRAADRIDNTVHFDNEEKNVGVDQSKIVTPGEEIKKISSEMRTILNHQYISSSVFPSHAAQPTTPSRLIGSSI